MINIYDAFLYHHLLSYEEIHYLSYVLILLMLLIYQLLNLYILKDFYAIVNQFIFILFFNHLEIFINHLI